MPDPLDQTGLLCDPFYELKEPLGRSPRGHPIVQPGQLILAHQIYPEQNPFIVEVSGYDARDTTKSGYTVTKYDPSSPPKPHFPMKELNLRSDENFYVMRGKLRPAIVLQTISTDFYNLSNPEPYVWAAPCFTFKEKHPQSYRCRVAAMKLPHLFYLPAHHHGCTEPSVLRFEHIQPVAAAAVKPLFISGKQSFLSEPAWAILQHQLHKFITGKALDGGIEETLQAYGQIVLEAFGLPAS